MMRMALQCSTWCRRNAAMSSWLRALLSLPGMRTMGATMGAFQRIGYWEQAFGVLTLMKQGGLVVNVVTLGAALAACEACRRWECALALFWQPSWKLYTRNGEESLIAKSCTVSTLASCRLWSKAAVLLAMHKQAGAETDVILCNSLARACESILGWHWVLKLLSNECSGGRDPDTVSMISALHASGLASGWRAAISTVLGRSVIHCSYGPLLWSAAVWTCEVSGGLAPAPPCDQCEKK